MTYYDNDFKGGVSNLGNTAGTTGTVGGQVIFVGGANITLSESKSGARATVTIIGGAGGGGGTGVAISAAGNSVSDGTVVFSNAGNVSFGMAGSTVTATATVTQSNQNITAGNGGFAFQTLSFSNANNVSFSTSAGSAIVASATFAQTNQTLGLYAVGNTTGESSSSTFDARTLSFRGDGFISVGYSGGSIRISGTQTNPVVSNAIQSVGSATGSGTNTSRFAADDHVHAGVFSVGVSTGGNTAGDTRVDVGRFVLAGGANITLSQATAANALNTISIVGGAGGGGETRLTAYAVSNTTQSTTGTIPLSSVQFAGAGIASVGITNGSVVISVPAGGGAGDGGVFAGVSNLGNTAGSTGTVSTGNFVLVGASGAITLSQSTAAAGSHATVSFIVPQTSSLSATGAVSISTNGSTISIGAPGVATLSAWQLESHQGSGIVQTQDPGNGSIRVFPVDVAGYYTFSKFLASVSLSISSSSNSSHGGTLSVGVGFYSRNVSTLSLATSGLGTFAWTNTSNNSTASLSGIREVSGSFANMSLTPGDWWVGFWSRTSTVNANWFTASNILYGSSQSNTTHSGNFLAAAAAASFQPGVPGKGTYSATSNVLPASMAFSHITGTARWWHRPHLAFRNFDG